MTISSTTSRNQYTATSGQTSFTYTFKIFDDDDILVLQNDVTLTKTTHYTVSDVGNASGGTITLVTGATTGDIITIIRNEPLTQEIDYVDGDDFPAAAHEEGLDRGVIRDQSQQEELDRSFKFTAGSNISSITTEISLDSFKGYGLGFNSSTGQPEPLALSDGSSTSVTATGTNTSRSLANRFTDIHINVKDFGAAGDGTTDDTTAIQAAIDYCVDAGLSDKPYALFFPVGDYLITSTLTVTVTSPAQLANFRMYGVGTGHSGSGSNNTDKPVSRILWGLTSTDATTYMINLQSPSGSFSHLRFNQVIDLCIDAQGYVSGVQSDLAMGTLFERVHFNRCINPFQCTDGGFTTTFMRCEFYDCTGIAIDLQDDCHKTNIIDCKFTGQSTKIPSRILRIGSTDSSSVVNFIGNQVETYGQTTAATISGITQANPAVVTTSAAHGFSDGDVIFIAGVVGMTEVNNITFTVANSTSTTFELSGIDSSAYTAYSSGGKVIEDTVYIEAFECKALNIQDNYFEIPTTSSLSSVIRLGDFNTTDHTVEGCSIIGNRFLTASNGVIYTEQAIAVDLQRCGGVIAKANCFDNVKVQYYKQTDGVFGELELGVDYRDGTASDTASYNSTTGGVIRHDYRLGSDGAIYRGGRDGATDFEIGTTTSPAEGSYFKGANGRAYLLNDQGDGIEVVSGAVGSGSNAALRPLDDGTQRLGSSTFRWSEVFASNGTINTSDERAKTGIEPIPQSWLDAWGEVEFYRYKWNSGKGGEWQVGVIAQRVIDAFANKGIDAKEIGLVYYPEENEGLYGIRYDQALILECAYLRSKLK